MCKQLQHLVDLTHRSGAHTSIEIFETIQCLIQPQFFTRIRFRLEDKIREKNGNHGQKYNVTMVNVLIDIVQLSILFWTNILLKANEHT